MSSVTSDVCKRGGGSLSALLAFMRLQVPLHSLHMYMGWWQTAALFSSSNSMFERCINID
jgi:hypothetical protein